MKKKQQCGFTLLELMIALSVGVLLIGGTVTMMANSGDALKRNEINSDMVSAIRLASNTIRHDVQSAGYFGRTRYPGDITGRTNDADPLPNLTGDCAAGFYTDIQRYIYASNGTNPFSATCIPASYHYVAGTDVLVVRYARENGITGATALSSLNDNALYVYGNPTGGELFRGNTPPSTSSTPYSGNFDSNIRKRAYEIVTHVYFVGRESATGPSSLYRLEPSMASGAPFVRQLISSDIEDLQVVFGVDNCNPDNIIGANVCDGTVDMYVDPDNATFQMASDQPIYSSVPRILSTAVSFTALSDRIEGSGSMGNKDHWLKGLSMSSSTASIFQAETFHVRNSEEIL